MNRRNFVALATGAMICGSAISQVASKNGVITIYVPFAAGGPTDVMARVLGEVVGEREGQPVIVENKPGAGGQLAASAAKQVRGDAVSLLIGDWAMLGSNTTLYKKLSYDPIAEFQPVTSLLSFPMVLYVSATNPANSLKDLLAQSKTKGLTYASQGPGTAGHLLGAMLQRQFQIDMQHVPYKGSGPAMQDLLGGQVSMLFDGLPAGLQHVKDGRLKALAITSQKRSEFLPNVPTVAEVNAPELAMDVWFGIVARNGLPKETILRLNKDFVGALAAPKVATRFKDQGYDIIPMSSEKFGAFMKAESARWGAAITANQISVD